MPKPSNTFSGFALTVLAASLAHAQPAATYPVKPVRFISPFPPGGPTDILARPVAGKLQEIFGQPFVIDFRSGASGTIGADHVAKSAPDGYTLLLITGSFNTAPGTHVALPYDVLKDFVGLSPLARGHSVLAVHPGIPARTLKELVALAKAQPGKLNYASSGAGGVIHLGTELFKLAAGVNMVHVPYKGVGPALQDVIGGYVDLMFIGAAPVIGHIRSGKLRALAVASPQRSAAFPGTPTVAESGYAGFEINSAYGILAASAVPKGVVSRLNGALEKILAQPDIRKSYATFGVDPWWEPPERYTAWLAEDIARWSAVAKAIKYQPE